MLIRPATLDDEQAIWRIIGPTIRAGETYALDRDIRGTGLNRAILCTLRQAASD
jgi:hypothetical protein